MTPKGRKSLKESVLPHAANSASGNTQTGNSAMQSPGADGVRSAATSTTVEASLLFWLQAAIDSAAMDTAPAETQQRHSSPAADEADTSNRPQQQPPAHAEAVVGHASEQTGAHADSSGSINAAELRLPPTPAEQIGEPEQQQQQQQKEERGGPSPSPPPPRLVLRDVMPLFDTLLHGQLGPVVIDVQLQGSTRLLQDPQQFESLLRTYEQQSSAELTESLHRIQPFFLLNTRREAQDVDGSGTADATQPLPSSSSSSSSASLSRCVSLYTMDPGSRYPVVPLLAQLLHAPAVTKILLHCRLLYRLLFLFLGTDRVDIQNVVDLTTWSELGRQLRPSLARVFPVPTGGVVQLADVMAVLPSETRRVVAEEARAMAQQQDASFAPSAGMIRQPSGVNGVVNDKDGRGDGVAAARANGSGGSGMNSEGSGGRYGAGSLSSDVGSAMDDEEAEVTGSEDEERDEEEGEDDDMDAVELLGTITPIHQQQQQQPIRRNARTADSHRRKRGRDDPYSAADHSSARLHHRPPQLYSSDSTGLANVYEGLAGLMLFFSHVMTRFFDNISGIADATHYSHGDAAAGSYRFSPSQWCVQRTYAQFLCEVMAYHGVFVNDGTFHAMHTRLDVQLQTIEDLAERVLAALEERTGGHDASSSGAVGVPSPLSDTDSVMREEHFRACLSRGAGAALVAAHRKLDAALLVALAHESTTTNAQDGHSNSSDHITSSSSSANADSKTVEQLRLSCQLVCLWIAYRERTEAKQRLSDAFNKVAHRLQTHVMEQPQSGGAADGRDLDRLRDPARWASVFFSVHPTWTLHNSSTGRIFSMMPNVQTLSKQPQHVTFAVTDLRAKPAEASQPTRRPYGAVDPPSAADVARWLRLVGHGSNSEASTANATAAALHQHHSSPPASPALLFPEQAQWTMRHLYCAPPGCLLVSFDYNQLELRVLAQLSGDAALQQHLSSHVDVLTLTTASLLQLPAVEQVRPHQRQAVKVIVYGLLYGMGVKLMEQRIAAVLAAPTAAADQQDACPSSEHQEAGADGGGESSPAVPLTAQQLLTRFFQVYPRVETYLRDTRQDGLQLRTVGTLSGRKSLADVTNPNQRKQRAVAQAIQGGAADIVLCAMRAVHQARHTFVPYLPAAPLALVMAVHDELVYAVPKIAVDEVVPRVKGILEEQARALRLAVPLPVSVRVGKTFGSLEEY